MKPWPATQDRTGPDLLQNFKVTILLPSNSPVQRVEGQWQSCKKLAESHACLEAVKQLHKVSQYRHLDADV